MDTRDTSALPRPASRNTAKNHPSRGRNATAGVVHDNVRHGTRFTVIGNHLAQHAELSLLAIGLAVHIQSLPTGAPVGIKALASRFPEGTTRIAAALRELEEHGYLRRTRERTASGQVVTRTVSCNQPGRTGTPNGPKPRSTPKPQPPPRRGGTPPQRQRALPPVPQPAYPAPDLLVTAIGVLAGLRREDERLHLSAKDVDHLAPGVATWLERGVPAEAVHRVLTAGLPREPLHRPAALLAHRLTAQLPPLLPFRPREEPSVRHPLQNCEVCDRAFRAPEPGTCGGCASAG
ncbi:helix-turn-helix domain-containing protein [Streptomyces sp. NPDC058877]|uniref:helix-turn-helix domain-containing protein n=1 Tax=Streptomyces sp. NPDC058877 TaxID=3346665 RepID=UPI0036AEE5F7